MFDRHFAHWPPGAPRTLDLPRISVYGNLAASAGRHPDRTLIDYYGSRFSYAELKREADALAGFLQQRCAVARGERVLIYLQNSPQFLIAYYAILRADAVVVPVNPMNRTEELRHYVEDAQTRVAIVGQELYERIAPLGVPHVIVATYSDYLGARSDDRSYSASRGLERKSTSMVVIADHVVTPARSICIPAQSRSQRDSTTSVAPR